jgi:hypothetical protein
MPLPSLLTTPPPSDLDPADVEEAAEEVREYCRWHIAPLVTETVAPVMLGRRAILPTLRLAAVTAVTVSGASVLFDWTLGNPLILDARFAFRGPVLVTMTHGFEKCPATVRKAVYAKARGAGPQRVQQQQVGDVAVSYFDDASSASDLDAYRLPVIG